jgi:hypothetical protein
MKNHYLKGLCLLFINLFFICICSAQCSIVDIGSTDNLYDIHFINKDSGWVAGDNKVYKTEDAGINWIPYNSAVTDTRYYGVSFKNELDGWAVGKKKTSSTAGRIHYTKDGGLTWQVVFDDNVATPFIAPVLTTESKIYFYYNIEDEDNTPPVCTVVEEFISFNGDVVKIGARYLGNGLLQLWLDFSFDETPRNLTISIPDSITEDDISISFDETTRPPDFQLELEIRQDVKESINLFAGGSIVL